MDQKKEILKQGEDARPGLFRLQIQAGMTQAAEMLSRFLQPGHQFRIQLMDENTPPPRTSEQPLAGVCLKVEGDIDGAILLLFSADNACRLAGLLLRQDPPTDLEGDPLRSTLREVGNIFSSGVLAALDNRMKLRALPSPPTFLSGVREKIEEQCGTCCLQKEITQIQARFDCDSPDGVLIEGSVVFQLATESLEQFVLSGESMEVAPAVPS